MDENEVMIDMVRDADKKHSVTFKAATPEDAKVLTGIYLMRPFSDDAQRIMVTIKIVE